MNKKHNKQASYREYLITLMKRHNFSQSQSEFTKRINVSRIYLIDLLKEKSSALEVP